MERMLEKLSEKRGAILLIAMLIVTFLGAMSVAVMSPVGTSAQLTETMYSRKKAVLTADSAAERVKFFMTRVDADPAVQGTSLAVQGSPWSPQTAPPGTNGETLDTAGHTYPTVDQKEGGTHLFDLNLIDPKYPRIPGLEDVDYIVYSRPDGANNAASFVSARCGDEIVNVRVAFERTAGETIPHDSFFHAVFVADEGGTGLYKLTLQEETTEEIVIREVTEKLLGDGGFDPEGDLSTHSAINIKADLSKGHLGFRIPDITFEPGTQINLKMPIQSIPGGDVTVDVHVLDGPQANQFDVTQFEKIIGTFTAKKGEMSHALMDFPLDAEFMQSMAGKELYLSFHATNAEGIDTSEIPFTTVPVLFKGEPVIDKKTGLPETVDIATRDGKMVQALDNKDAPVVDKDGNPVFFTREEYADYLTINGSAIHFKIKEGDDAPTITYTFEDTEITKLGNDAVTGDVYVSGSVDMSEGEITGNITVTADEVTGAPVDGEVETGADEIEAPVLDKEDAWYTDLALNDDGTESKSTVVVTDATNGAIDGDIGGFLKTYDSDTDSGYIGDITHENGGSAAFVLSGEVDEASGAMVVEIPDDYNNKAIYVPGDLWVDSAKSQNIDIVLVDSEGQRTGERPNLTFITEGDTHFTDGFNQGLTVGTQEGMVSVLSLTRDDGSGGDIYYNDPSGTVAPVSAYMHAENDLLVSSEAADTGIYLINGNTSTNGIINLDNREMGDDFMPLTITFDGRILLPENYKNMPAIPSVKNDDVTSTSPFGSTAFQYLD